MGKRGPKKVEKVKESKPFFEDLSPQARQAIGAVLLTTVGIFFAAALFEYGGVVGSWTQISLYWLFGTGAYLAPMVCAFYVYALLNPKDNEEVSMSKITGIGLLFISLLGILEISVTEWGGMVGWVLLAPLSYLFGASVAGVILGGLILISGFLIFNTGLRLPQMGREQTLDDESDIENLVLQTGPESEEDFDELLEEENAPDATAVAKRPTMQKVSDKLGLGNAPRADFVVSTFSGTYAPPSLSLLKKDQGKPQTGDVKANANIIKRTLKEFGIHVEMDAVEIGPTISRYALKPAQGVKIARIVGLQQELQLNLSSGTLRIEAPIPGKSLVGIEIPNLTRSTIGLASLLKTPEYTDSPHPLYVALGKDVTGNAHFANIARMPHALVAGTTGSGKSITMHNLVISLLFRNSPDQLRFFMVDPKRVELTLYEGIPHLLAPVIVEAKKALMMLKWAIKEMERRYDILQTEKIQNLDSYHANVYKPAKKAWEAKGSPEEELVNLPEPLPYIVILMDELADLMHAYPRELEAAIVRLAQMSRAVGIHLILATQRPSVNVITGTIKANIPTRIALNVASQIDSRTILDGVGAEKLLGKGDMLYLSSDSPKPVRLQAAFISEDEIKNVVSYLKMQDSAHSLDSINLDEKSGGSGDSFIGMINDDDSDDDDELYEDAKQAVIEAGKASTSYIQRKLRVGYSRAARLIDLLEDRGVIGAADGSKPREILGSDGGGSDDTEDDIDTTNRM
ncbi:MAG: DNA translocase FtsK 4TM domain-containing protein [Patescibacteria group bacterium]